MAGSWNENKCLLGLLILIALVILSVVVDYSTYKEPKKQKSLVDFSFVHHYTIKPADVSNGQWVRIKQGVTVDRKRVLHKDMYVSFWATGGWQYWCLEATLDQWKAPAPPGDEQVKTVTPDDYDKFESTTARSSRIFRSIDIDGSGHIDADELHPEIITALKAKVGQKQNDNGRLTHKEVDSLISHHLLGEERSQEDEALEKHVVEAVDKARKARAAEF